MGTSCRHDFLQHSFHDLLHFPGLDCVLVSACRTTKLLVLGSKGIKRLLESLVCQAVLDGVPVLDHPWVRPRVDQAWALDFWNFIHQLFRLFLADVKHRFNLGSGLLFVFELVSCFLCLLSDSLIVFRACCLSWFTFLACWRLASRTFVSKCSATSWATLLVELAMAPGLEDKRCQAAFKSSY